MNRIIFYCLLYGCLVAATASCVRESVEYPNNRIVYLKNANLAIVGVDANTRDDTDKIGDNHGLYITKHNQINLEQILSYSRHLTLFWNRDETQLAIIDSIGSNRQTFFIYDVKGSVLHEIKIPELSNLPPDDHYSFKFLGWKDQETVAIRVFGYGAQEWNKTVKIPVPK